MFLGATFFVIGAAGLLLLVLASIDRFSKATDQVLSRAQLITIALIGAALIIAGGVLTGSFFGTFGTDAASAAIPKAIAVGSYLLGSISLFVTLVSICFSVIYTRHLLAYRRGAKQSEFGDYEPARLSAKMVMYPMFSVVFAVLTLITLTGLPL